MSKNSKSYAHTVTELFERQTTATPKAVAIHDGNQQLTYEELNEKANQMAFFLLKRGLLPNDFVALLLEPSIDFVVCILAIIKAGGVYLPVDTLSPKNRIEDIIQDANPRLIIASLLFTQKYGLNYGNLLEINELTKKIPNIESTNIQCSIEPSSPIYMMYTSGSTGKPKGVIITHQGVVNLAKIVNYADMYPSKRMGQFSNLAFDASTMEIWDVLLNGATLYIIPTLIRESSSKFKEFLYEHDIKYLYLPTAYFHQLSKNSPHVIDGLERLVIGGEQVNASILNSFLNYRKEKQLPLTIVNAYGPTEATTTTTCHLITIESDMNLDELSSIGKAIDNVKTYILNEDLQPVVPGEPGELYISGVNLALGYHNAPSQNSEKFIKNPFCKNEPYQQLYKTGDLVKELPSGNLFYIERLDDQIKINGFRVHLNEIENQLMTHQSVKLAVVLGEKGGGSHNLLSAYIIPLSDRKDLTSEKLREYLELSLPPYMIPTKYFIVDSIPLTSLGKVNKKKLIAEQIIGTSSSTVLTKDSNIEERLQLIWKDLLNLNTVDVDKNLFDLGANSLLIMEACAQINKEFQCALEISHVLSYTTIRKLSNFLKGDQQTVSYKKDSKVISQDIAVVGMACRFPKANTIAEYWDNLCNGKDCLTRFSESELDETNREHFENKKFVPVRGILSEVNQFDAHFFGFNPIDASITDPQQRLFLECAWEALEYSGNIPSKSSSKLISVFAGMADTSYLHENLLKNDWFCQNYDRFQARIATSGGMLSTQVSYRLNLTGNSININTACSTGLVAVAQACRDLSSGSSDIALAGAVSILVPQIGGYFYQKDSIESSDGQCRPFSLDSNGTVFSNGVGVVVLKRLADAIADNDTIYAVVKGYGINNDGSNKLSYTAPSVPGQEGCIKTALNDANISPNDIGFIEAHGTGTALGDVIEVAALKSAYITQTQRQEPCVLGSVKGNIGHTDIAAGIAGFIKTTLCLYHQKIPPTRNFQSAHPSLNLSETTFYVNNQLIDWETNINKRYAAVSALGVGGTNAHVILEQYSQSPASIFNDNQQLFIFSAKTQVALQQQETQFISYLAHDNVNSLADIAYTLQTGREDFEWRSFVIGKSRQEIITHLKEKHAVDNATLSEDHASIVFMFPGQGTQYYAMAEHLYREIPYFTAIVDECSQLAESHLNMSIVSLLFGSNHERINETLYAQLVLFIIEYALAKLLLYYGVAPSALIGHSSGEYVAACLAGVFSLEDAIFLVYQRGQLMSTLPKGGMLSVSCSKEEFFDYKKDLPIELSIENMPRNCIVSGTLEAITAFQEQLSENNVTYQKLNVNHAFHNQVMKLIEKPFKQLFEKIKLSAPKIPIISNVSGTVLTKEQAVDPEYWYQHLRQMVQFRKGIETLLVEKKSAFVEVGPGHTLTTFTKNIARKNNNTIYTTHVLPNQKKSTTDLHQLFTALGVLWQVGSKINWSAFHGEHQPKHIALPTYPFQKQTYWVEPNAIDRLVINKSQKQLFFQPSWLRHDPYSREILNPSAIKQHPWIIFTDQTGLANTLFNILKQHTDQIIIVEQGEDYQEINSFHYVINPAKKSHYMGLFTQLDNVLYKEPIILHCFSCIKDNERYLTTPDIDNQLSLGFYSLFYLSQAYTEKIREDAPIKCAVITMGSQKVFDNDCVSPVNATLSGSHRVINQEHPSLKLELIDISSQEIAEQFTNLSMTIINHCANSQWQKYNSVLALRHGYHWQYTNEIVELSKDINRLKDNGVYVLTGGMGGVALEICEAISKSIANPTLILISRTPTPPQSEWENINQNTSHPFYKKIHRLLSLQKLGCHLRICEADVGIFSSIEPVINTIIDEFGVINGLIHAAGVPGKGLIQLKEKKMAQAVLVPKIHGTYYLARLLKERSLDFVVLFSSISSLIGEIGQIDYSGANACLDAFAVSELFNASHTVSINWNTWKDVGMTVTSDGSYDVLFFDRGNDITPADGQEIFLKIMRNNYHQLIVSNMNLVEFSQNSNLQHSIKHIAQPQKTQRDLLHIKSSYLSPRNSIEKTLVTLWQEKLGIDSIGIRDDFFDLGGHSLKALELIDAINKKIHCNLIIQDLYESKTISELSLRIKPDRQLDNVLVPLLVNNKTLPNVFVFHPVSGMVYCYNHLVSLWELPYSIYGVQDPSINDREMLFDNVPDMAKTYLEAIKRIQSKGPYYFIGYSFGANVMHEVVHLLKQQNETIKMAAIIDGWAISSKEEMNEDNFRKRFLQSRQDIPVEIVDLSWKRMNLLFKHQPSKIDQDIILFKATELFDEYTAIDHIHNGWDQCNEGQITCHLIDANHDTILEEHNISLILKLLQPILIEN